MPDWDEAKRCSLTKSLQKEPVCNSIHAEQKTARERNRMQPKKIAIVGGNGRYGKFFKDFLEKKGHEVRVSDVGTTPSNEEIVRGADVVLIAVTLLKTVPVIESLVPLLRHDQLVMDITSVKAGPVEAMLKSKAEVVGLHPFTAPPKHGTFRGQTMFVVYARLSVWRDWVNEFLLSTEAVVKVVDSNSHDRERAVDQVLEHMCTAVKVAVMRRLGLDASHLFEVASPVYKLTAVQMARMFAQSADLYGGLPMVNPHAVATLEMFGEEFRHYVEVVKNSDLARYAADFAANKAYIGPDNIQRSFALSEKIVGLMANLCSRQGEKLFGGAVGYPPT